MAGVLCVKNIANHIKCQIRDAVGGTLATWSDLDNQLRKQRDGYHATDATRIEEIGFFSVFTDLIQIQAIGPVPRGQVHKVEGDLKFGEWLNAAALLSISRYRRN